jgi:M6 family metalloprotease-like protein
MNLLTRQAKRTRWVPITLLILGASLVTTGPLLAAPANSTPFSYIQPNGTKVMLRLRGDEFFHWHEDLAGFTVVAKGEAYYYAQLNAGGQLEATAWLAGSVDPATKGLTPGILPPKALRPPNLNDGHAPYRPWIPKSTPAKSAGGVTVQSIAASGTVKNLVILCLFKGHTIAANARQQSDYDTLFNKVGGDTVLAPTGSVRDAYTEMSYNKVTLQSTVLAWVTLPQDMAYYAGTNNGQAANPPLDPPADPTGYPHTTHKMVEDALALVDPLVDFGQFDTDNDGYIDAIDIIHSGYGAEQGGAPANSIWSIKSNLATDFTSADNNANGVKVKVRDFHTEPALWGTSGTGILHIGVICHETGHFFGLPDLYDTDNSSDGIGSWCMMANSWGFDGTQTHPPHFSAWCKIFLGWVTPTLLDAPGTYTVNQAETNKSVYQINRGFVPGEYLLIENRQPVGLENVIPQGGLAIWHVDESVTTNKVEGFPGQAGWPGNGNHFKIALLQADGKYDLEKIAHGNPNQRGDAGDVYHGNGVKELGLNTVPNTDRYKLGTAGPTGIRITNISASGASMTFDYVHPQSILYVDKNYTGSSIGSADQPYHTVTDAYNAAIDGDTIIIRSADYFEAPLSGLTKRVTFDSRLGSSSVK